MRSWLQVSRKEHTTVLLGSSARPPGPAERACPPGRRCGRRISTVQSRPGTPSPRIRFGFRPRVWRVLPRLPIPSRCPGPPNRGAPRTCRLLTCTPGRPHRDAHGREKRGPRPGPPDTRLSQVGTEGRGTGLAGAVGKAVLGRKLPPLTEGSRTKTLLGRAGGRGPRRTARADQTPG